MNAVGSEAAVARDSILRIVGKAPALDASLLEMRVSRLVPPPAPETAPALQLVVKEAVVRRPLLDLRLFRTLRAARLALLSA